MTVEQTVKLEGSPYYLHQTESGLFYAIKCAMFIKNDTKDQKEWTYESHSDIGQLLLGRDITESDTKGMPILVRVLKEEHILPRVIEECRKFAEISWHDYTSVKVIDGYIGRHIATEKHTEVFEIRPRLFRKNINT